MDLGFVALAGGRVHAAGPAARTLTPVPGKPLILPRGRHHDLAGAEVLSAQR
ncbi:hypothetical protein ACI8AG_08530 [Blastococcus sp. SYSU DS0552]